MVRQAFDLFFVLALIAPAAAVIIGALLMTVRPHLPQRVHTAANAAAHF